MTKRHYMTGVLGAVVTFITGCDVINPGPIQDEFLVEEESRVGLVNGAQRQLVVGLAGGSAEALVALAARYKLDGVLVGTITSYRPYLPPTLGMRTKLFSVHSGSYVWAAEGLYDAKDARTMEDLEHYQKSFLATETSMHGMRINLLSPARFAAYVSHRLVGTWRSATF